MHKARSFFYVCAGIFLLALAYHLGAVSATAQAPDNPVVAAVMNPQAASNQWVFTANGDIYYTTGGAWAHGGNIFSAPTPTTQETWGGVKARYRPEGKAQDR